CKLTENYVSGEEKSTSSGQKYICLALLDSFPKYSYGWLRKVIFISTIFSFLY
ncbi:unnamed protein product, partial [Brassica oleracea var. botrytis]